MKRKPLRKFTFRVTIRLNQNPTEPRTDDPNDSWTGAGVATIANVKAHIKDAVQSWGGQCPPDYPFWPDNMKTTVTRVK